MMIDPALAAAAARQARAQAKGSAAAKTSVTLNAVPSTDTAPDDEAGTPSTEGGPATGMTAQSQSSRFDSSASYAMGLASVTKTEVEGVARVGPPTRSRALRPRVLLKIIVLGCSNVGKTSLMKRYVANDFSDKRRPTIGADFMTKEIVAGDQPMLLQIWDTAGQERFHQGALGAGFFRGASAALLVYDIASAKSFEQVAMWREELLVRLDVNPYDFPIVVIGNKVDLLGEVPMDGVRGVDKQVVLRWCEMQGMGHIETSAKDGTGVEVAMQAVAMLALDQKRKRDREVALNPTLAGGRIDLSYDRGRQNGDGSCC
ncbi:unnamed protein product [Discosporangium mesarthrocarpum]